MNKNIGITGIFITATLTGLFILSGRIANKEELASDAPTPPHTRIVEQGVEQVVSGSYLEYSADTIKRVDNDIVVLFFHAAWCPSCRGLNSDIEKNLSKIPAGITILKVDYDKENELKKKYGVTTQHTLVVVSKDGGHVKKWSGGLKLDDLLSKI